MRAILLVLEPPAACPRHTSLAYCTVKVGQLDGRDELNVAYVRCFLGHNLEAASQRFDTSDRWFKAPSACECSPPDPTRLFH